MKIRWVLIAVLLLLTAGRASAQTDAISFSEYESLLESIRERLLTPGQPAAESLISITAELEAIDTVHLASGDRVPVDHSYIAGLLRADPPEIERAAAILDTTIQEMQKIPQQSFSRENLDELSAILNRAEYQWVEEAPNPLYELWLKFTNWFLRLVSRLFPGIENTRTIFNVVLFILLGSTLALIFSFVYRSLAKNVRHEAEIDRFDRDLENLTAHQAQDKAEALAAAGDRRTAVRYLYISALLVLIENDLLSVEKTRTNNEILAELKAMPEISVAFKKITPVFDYAWYGLHPIDDQTFQTFSRRVDELKSLKGSTG